MTAMRFIARAFVIVAALAGCNGGATEVRVQITDPTGLAMPATVGINVFDAYGRIGHIDVSPATLPGAVTVTGLPAVAEELRVVAIGISATGVKSLGGVRVQVQPGTRVVAPITLSTNFRDSDGDDVPDSLDDCVSTDDPMQESALGDGVGDACRANADLSGIADLYVPPGSDLSGSTDMAGAVSGCPTAGVAFCDGFESGAIDSHWNSTVNVNGTVTVDSTRAYRGSYSLHIHNNALAAKATADVELNEGLTFPSNHFFIRAYVWVPSAFTNVEADFILAEQDVPPYSGVTLALINGMFKTDNMIANLTKTSSTMAPRDQWVCLEWEVQLGSSGYTALQVNGTTVAALSGTQNLQVSPAINAIGMALVTTAPPSSSVPARDLWFDEVMIDSSAIGCAR
jgi:hypothetical protein